MEEKMSNKIYEAVNWNTPENDYVEMFWEQNLKQFWIDTEYIPSKDIDSWHSNEACLFAGTGRTDIAGYFTESYRNAENHRSH